MVFNVSGNLDSKDKVGVKKQDADLWEVESSNGMLGLSKRPVVIKRNTCCIVIPWILLCLSLVMMGLVGSWGWREHYKLQDMIQNQEKMANADPFYKGEKFGPLSDEFKPMDQFFTPEDSENEDDYPNDVEKPIDDTIPIDSELPVTDGTTPPTETETRGFRIFFRYMFVPRFRQSDTGNSPRPHIFRYNILTRSDTGEPMIDPEGNVNTADEKKDDSDVGGEEKQQ